MVRGERCRWRSALLGLGLTSLVVAACSTTRVVPVPAGGVALDPTRGTATTEAYGVQLVVRPSAWQGSPSYLPAYVTPFHLLIVDGSPEPLAYGYADLRLFDEARFQYTALPPAEVERILRAAGAGGVVVATAEVTPSPLLRRRWVHDPFWDWWWWHRPSEYAPPLPRLDDVYLQALPVGTLQAGARVQGFAYFPRLRPEASRLTFEFHHRLGGAPRVLSVPFGVERADRRGRGAVS